MAGSVGLKARRAGRLSGVDAFLWFVRVVALVAVVWGSYKSITSGRLTAAQWRGLIVAGVSQGAVYGLVALGYTMVYGVLRFINFAHGEVFMAGSMIGFFVANGLSGTAMWASLPLVALLIALLAAMATSTSISLVLERVAYRPLRGLPRLVPFITAVGASFFLQYAFAGLFGADSKAYPPVEVLKGGFTIAGFVFGRTQTLVIVASIVMMIGLYLFVERTKAGRAIRAVSEDQEMASLMGINVDRSIALVFAVGGAMAGAGGLLYGLTFGQVDFLSGFLVGIKAFTASVLGGIGNLAGAMVGGLVLGLIESLGPSLVLFGLGVPSAHQLQDVVAFLALVMILIFRPTGILGERLAEERA
jgi:branched-chain amino acid transport system permease protein